MFDREIRDDPHDDRLRLLRTILRIVGTCAFLLFVQFPLRSVERMVKAVAGRHTTANATIGLTMTVKVAATLALGTGALMAWKTSRQRQQLVAARRRITELERRVSELTQHVSSRATGGSR